MLERMISEETDTSDFDFEKMRESLLATMRNAETIEQMGDAVIPGLCYALGHPDPGIRCKSCWALQILGSHSGLPDSAITEIVKHITDPDEKVCSQVLHSLDVLAENGKLAVVVPDLIAALKSENQWVRRRVAMLLGKIGAEAVSARDSLRPLLDDPDIDVSETAKKAFVALGGKVEAVNVGAATEVERLVRLAASSVYGGKGWEDLEKLPNREVAIDPLMKAFRESGGKIGGMELSKFLGKVGTEACRAPLLEILEYARRSSDKWEQEHLAGSACLGLLNLKEGVSTLRRVTAPELLRFILMRGLMSADDRERFAVAKTLTIDERRGTIEDVISLFRSAKEKDRWIFEVSYTLQALGTDAIDALLEVYRNVKPGDIRPNGYVPRNSAGEAGAPASAMVRIPGGIERLRALCRAEEYEKILIRAHNYGDASNPAVNRALGEIATPMAIGRLLNVLWQNLEEIRKSAREALIKVGKKAHEPLLNSLEITVPENRGLQTDFRKQVLAVLSETGDGECVAAILTVLASDPPVAAEAQAALEAIGKRCGEVAASRVDAPRSLPIKKIAETGDPYADDCFRIDFDEFYEEREWFDMPEAKAIPDAGNAGRIDEALRLAEALRQKYPDFYFVYNWFAILYRKQKRYGDARNSLTEGLRLARSKHNLCTAMGELEWERQNLSEAVKWWIKSAAVQVGAQYVTDYVAFLHLSYVADAVGMSAVCAKLRSWVDRLRSGQIRLNAQAANEIYLATNRQATPAVRLALELLDIHYLSNREG
jgi:HEAT repeat protein